MKIGVREDTFLALFFLFMATVLVYTPGCRNPDEINVKFSHDSFDHGQVPLESKPRHSFDFINQGRTTVRIKGVQSACGCETPRESFTQEPIPPGGNGFVEFSASPAARGKTRVSKVYVRFEAERTHRQLTEEMIELEQVCSMEYGVTFDRETVDINAPYSFKDPIVQEVSLMYDETECPEMAIFKVKCDAPFLRIFAKGRQSILAGTSREGRSIRAIPFIVEILPSAQPGRFTETVTIETSCDTTATLEIRGRVEGCISLDRDSIVLTAMGGQSMVDANLDIEANSAEHVPPQIDKKTLPTGFSTSVIPDLTAGKWQIRIRWDVKSHPHSKKFHFTIEPMCYAGDPVRISVNAILLDISAG